MLSVYMIIFQSVSHLVFRSAAGNTAAVKKLPCGRIIKIRWNTIRSDSFEKRGLIKCRRGPPLVNIWVFVHPIASICPNIEKKT